MKIILNFIIVLLFASCNGSKKSTGNNPASSTNAGTSSSSNNSSAVAATTNNTVESQTAAHGPETIVIGYEKSVCFGTCPAFTMTLNAETNKATYTGTSNVEKIGTFEKNFSDEEIMKLKSAFDKAKFFEMENEYTNEISDLPSVYVSLSVDGKTKKIKDRYHAPKELKDLEKMLDSIADSEGWVKVKEKE